MIHAVLPGDVADVVVSKCDIDTRCRCGYRPGKLSASNLETFNEKLARTRLPLRQRVKAANGRPVYMVDHEHTVLYKKVDCRESNCPHSGCLKRYYWRCAISDGLSRVLDINKHEA